MSNDNVANSPKLALVPIDCDDLKPVYTMYNPESLSFTKKARFHEPDQVGGAAKKLNYSGGEPIDLDLELFFDCYESASDVRVLVKQVLDLAEPHKCTGGDKEDERPPKVRIVWKDTDPLGTGGKEPYNCVIDTVSVDYTMFLDDGTPCRAKVKVHTKQANDFEISADKETTSVTIKTAGLTPAFIESLKDGRSEIEKGGGKIEDPDTWPAEITIKFG